MLWIENNWIYRIQSTPLYLLKSITLNKYLIAKGGGNISTSATLVPYQYNFIR